MGNPEQDEKDRARLLSQLLEAEKLAHLGSWERDLVTDSITYTEELWKLVYGADRPDSPTFEDFLAWVVPEDRERVRRFRAEEIAGTATGRDLEYRVRHHDGTVHVFHSRSEVCRDTSGRALRVFGTAMDITDRRRAEEERDRRVRQQAAVAQLGETALYGVELQALFDMAGNLSARNCDADFAEVAELLPDETLILRAAVGWKEGLVGHVRLSAATGSHCAYTLLSDQPSVVKDFAGETRFSVDPLILEQGIVSDVTVLIRPEGRPFGTLGVGTRVRREFNKEDIHFLESMANVLAAAIHRERTAGELRQKREQLQSLSHKLIEAQEAERRAIARELHDDFGQVLTAIRLNLQRSGATTTQGNAESIALIDEAIGRLRDLALDLRPPALDDLGLTATLRWYVGREAERAGLEAHLEVDQLQARLPPGIETTCFRLVQEALNNVVRHAGARSVQVSLRAPDGDPLLLVRDDGKGFDVSAARKRAASGASQGLLTMQERVSLAGGTLSIESAAGRGTTIQVRFPVRGSREHDANPARR